MMAPAAVVCRISAAYSYSSFDSDHIMMTKTKSRWFPGGQLSSLKCVPMDLLRNLIGSDDAYITNNRPAHMEPHVSWWSFHLCVPFCKTFFLLSERWYKNEEVWGSDFSALPCLARLLDLKSLQDHPHQDWPSQWTSEALKRNRLVAGEAGWVCVCVFARVWEVSVFGRDKIFGGFCCMIGLRLYDLHVSWPPEEIQDHGGEGYED